MKDRSYDYEERFILHAWMFVGNYVLWLYTSLSFAVSMKYFHNHMHVSFVIKRKTSFSIKLGI